MVARAHPFGLLVAETLIASDPPHVRCSHIEVALWDGPSQPDGVEYRDPNHSLAVVGRLRSKTFDRLSLTGHDFDGEFPTSEQPTFPIDVVYTWVDDSDEAWQEQRKEYEEPGSRDSPRADGGDERYRNRYEVKYSLRSLELFAPWVRRIHLVTANQCPSLLNLDHPKINLVSHRDIFADQAWLPTFNPSAIETQLHHIEGLSTKFLYFNGDVFLGRSCDPSDFFYSNGILKFFPSNHRAYEGDIDCSFQAYIQADRNAIQLFRQTMPAVGRSMVSHAPLLADRELLAELEDRWPNEFALCASSRFRSALDLRPVAFMQYHYGYHRGRAIPSMIRAQYLGLSNLAVLERMSSVGHGRSFKTFCINDGSVQSDRLDEVNEAVWHFLEGYFPTPSAFEI